MRPLILCLLIGIAPNAHANTRDCGENAFTFAEVTEGKREARRGPITTAPDSLCADLIEDRQPAIGSLNLSIGDGYAGGPNRRPLDPTPVPRRRARD